MNKEKTIPVKELLPLLMAIFIDVLGFRLAYPVLAGMMTSTFSILPVQTSNDVRSIFLSLGYFLYPLFMLFGAFF